MIERRLAVLGRVIDPVLDGASVDALERMLAGLIAPRPFPWIDDPEAAAPDGPLVAFWQCPEPDQPIAWRSRPLSPATFIELVMAN